MARALISSCDADRPLLKLETAAKATSPITAAPTAMAPTPMLPSICLLSALSSDAPPAPAACFSSTAATAALVAAALVGASVACSAATAGLAVAGINNGAVVPFEPRVTEALTSPALAVAIVAIVGARDDLCASRALETRVAEALARLVVALTVAGAFVWAWFTYHGLNLLETHGCRRHGHGGGHRNVAHLGGKRSGISRQRLGLHFDTTIIALEASVAVALAKLAHAMVVAFLRTRLHRWALLLCLACLASVVRGAVALAQPADAVLAIAVLRALPLHMRVTCRARELRVAEALAQLALTVAAAALVARLGNGGHPRTVQAIISSLAQAAPLQTDSTLRAAVRAGQRVLTCLAAEARIAEALTVAADAGTGAVLRVRGRLGAVLGAEAGVAVALAQAAHTVARAIIDAFGRHL